MLDIYHALLEHFGPQEWWPADSDLEIVLGAVLVQNTNWQNVDKALNNLKKAKKLSWRGINSLSLEQLAGLIRPSGYYNIKAQRLHNLLALFKQYRPWKKFFQQPLSQAREQLLTIKGIGPETADVILLYVGKKPVFVADAYTLRMAARHGWLAEKASYHDMQNFFMAKLPESIEIFAEFHALIVTLGKNYCKKNNPLCHTCPLGPWKA